MLKHRDDSACPARGFYTYDAFIQAARAFPVFASTGDIDTRKREVAAFLGQTSHETSGGWATSPDGPYAWGYCFNKEVNPSIPFCDRSTQYPCAPGKLYYGRGPFLLSWNFNYGACGEAIAVDLLNNPDLVAADPVISFKTALWLWMTPRWPNIPSCHDVISGAWTPSTADKAVGRLSGYGATTNILNGGLECGRGQDARVEDRTGFYKRYCDILGVPYGDNLDCYSQRPFGSSSLVDVIYSHPVPCIYVLYPASSSDLTSHSILFNKISSFQFYFPLSFFSHLFAALDTRFSYHEYIASFFLAAYISMTGLEQHIPCFAIY